MGVMVMAPTSPAQPMPHPAPHARPGDSRDEDHECERHGDASDIENVVKCVVGRRIDRLGLLSVSDEHRVSRSVPARTCVPRFLPSIGRPGLGRSRFAEAPV